MSNVALIKNSFNAGELSPMLDGRTDLAKYNNGCSILENFIPLPQGPIIKRPGTRFINQCKDPGAWLIKFEFSLEQSFILEFGSSYIRFYFNYGLVLNPDNTPYEVANQFSPSDLTNDQGSFALSLKQSADVIYIASGGYPPQKLERIANDNWTLLPLDLKNGPFQDMNTDQSILLSVNSTGTMPPYYVSPGQTIEIISNVDLFTEDLVGTKIAIQPNNNYAVIQWQQLKAYPANAIIYNDGKYYYTQAGGTSGYIAPIQTVGTQSDGGIDWLFIGQDIVYFLIEEYVSPTQVTGTSLSYYPNGYIGSSPNWNLYAWYASIGFPDQVELFRSRLVFSRGQNIWFSKSGDFENFETTDFGNIVDDSAISITTASEGTTQIQNLTSTNIGLICSTDLDQIIVDNATPNLPFSPTNIQVNPGSGIGSRQLDLLRINDDLLFVTTSGSRICNLQYNANTTSFISPDISIVSDHILKPFIIDIVYQESPWNIIWMVRSDGELIGLTYNKDQDVVCFHRHNIGNGIVLAVQCIPNPNMQQDDLWMIVQRTINGNSVNYIEVLEPAYDSVYQMTPNYLPWYIDCGLSYTGAPVTNISGISQLSGQQISVMSDTGYQGPFTVSPTGTFTLTRASSNFVCGLPYTSTMQSMRIEAPSNAGTSQGAIKRITRCILRLFNSMGLVQVAPNFLGDRYGNYDELYFHKMDETLNIPVPAPYYTGDKFINLTGDYNEVGQISVLHSEPYPFTLICLILNVGMYA